MRHAPQSPADSSVDERLGVLTRERRVRMLNCSVSGCLIETNWRLQVGAIASIRVVIDGLELMAQKLKMVIEATEEASKAKLLQGPPLNVPPPINRNGNQ